MRFSTLPTETDRRDGRAPLGFLVFLAMMTSVIALTIDAVLPAFDSISTDLGFADANDRQLIVMIVFAGMGISQPVFGPLADSIGRKRAALLGWGIFVFGTLVAMFAASPEMMFAGRFLQGVGAGGPRIIAAAIARDLYEGRAMARILSLIMTIFMLVPMFAPLIGQWVEAISGWRGIFGLYLTMALLAAGWYLLGVPETLNPAQRRPLSFHAVLQSYREVLSNRVAMCYTFSAICVFGPFVVYLATAQQVLEELYGLGPLFPWAFGALAFAFAVASMFNSRLVMRFGMRRLSLLALIQMIAVAALSVGLIQLSDRPGVPPLWLYLTLMSLMFFAIAVLFANFNALALQPLGHIAGTASGAIMSLSTVGSVPVGYAISSSFEGSLTPMFAAFALLGVLGLVAMWIAERGRPDGML